MKYILLFLLFISSSGYANDALKSLLNEEANKRLVVSIQAKELETNKEIYAFNSYQRMTPASTTKSFIAYAALKYLGADFVYKTQISRDDNNNLYIKFSGDPSLTKQDFVALLAKVKNHPIENIIIDDSDFDLYYQANGWAWDDNKFCFAAPTSAIVIDRNCFKLDLLPAKTIDHISILNGKTLAKMSNQIITARDNKFCAPELMAHPDNSYELTGCINLSSPNIPLAIAYQDPRLMLQSLIMEVLSGNKLKITFQKVQSTAYALIAEHVSVPLSELVKHMMQNSENIYADNFTKTLGQYYYKTQGTFDNGTKAINEIIANKVKIFDGSGGSRYNLIAADQLVDLYMMAFSDKAVWPYFYDALATYGDNYHLEQKFTSELLKNKLHAKTGSMSGVNNLVGYLETKTGKTLIFTIMINGSLNKSDSNKLLENILLMLFEYSPSSHS